MIQHKNAAAKAGMHLGLKPEQVNAELANDAFGIAPSRLSLHRAKAEAAPTPSETVAAQSGADADKASGFADIHQHSGAPDFDAAKFDQTMNAVQGVVDQASQV